MERLAPAETGKKYALKSEYACQTGGALVKLFWSSPSVPRVIVPAQQLFGPQARNTSNLATNVVAGPPRSGLLGLYFNESDLSGEFKVRYDPTWISNPAKARR